MGIHRRQQHTSHPHDDLRRRLPTALRLQLSDVNPEGSLTVTGEVAHKVHTIRISSTAGESFPGLLLQPESHTAHGGAVVLIAGHGGGVHDLIARDPIDPYHRGIAHKFAAAGFTVICPEMVSFGARRRTNDLTSSEHEPVHSCALDATNALLNGKPILGARVRDAAVAAAAVATLPGVSQGKVAVAGGSGGGAVALMLAAASPHIQGALVANYFSTFSGSVGAVPHCPCNVVPGLLPNLDMPQIAALVAPRPLVIETGRDDPIFPYPATESAFRSLQNLWPDTQAPDPQLIVTHEAHTFAGEESVRAFTEMVTGEQQS